MRLPGGAGYWGGAPTEWVGSRCAWRVTAEGHQGSGIGEGEGAGTRPNGVWGCQRLPAPQVIFLCCGGGKFPECVGEAELRGDMGGALRAVGGAASWASIGRKAQFLAPAL